MSEFLIPRHKRKLVTDDTVAIRKMRELRSYTRDQAGRRVGLSGKQIEAIENGRVQLTDERIAAFCGAYSVTMSEYDLIKSGKKERDLLVVRQSARPKIIEQKKLRRSYKRVVTKKVRALISMRKRAGLSQDEASFRCGYSRSQFGHIENGRIELSETRIRHILSRLGFRLEEFEEEVLSDQTSTELRTECCNLLSTLAAAHLSNLLPLLKSMQAPQKQRRN